VKIATFNANSIRARLAPTLAWLDREAPDILCVQETKVADDAFPADAFRAVGYAVTFRGEKSYNGVAVISRTAPTAVAYGFDDGGQADETRLLYARFGSLHVVNTYIPQGRDIEHPMYRYKIEWLARLKAYFTRRFSTRMKVLWLGDMNVAPEAMDIHNAEQQTNHVCFHEDVRRAFADTVGWGFTDIVRRYHPGAGVFTFFDYRTPNAAKRGMGWRIDHILASPPLARRATGARIDLRPRLDERPSDHTFVVAEFDL